VTVRRLTLLLAAGAAVTAAAAAAQANNLSPQALYKALVKLPKGTTSLPAGYTSPTLGPLKPSSNAKRHHVIGEVSIGLAKTGTDGARILYIVFPTHADALADWKDGTSHLPNTRLTTPTNLPKPAVLFDAPVTTKSSSGKTITVGTTSLAYVSGNLIIEVDTSSTTSKAHGDPGAVPALAAFAASHLASVEHSVTPPGPIA
jgi:hypothetical protein